MIPLFALSITSVYVIIYKFFQLRKLKFKNKKCLKELFDSLKSGDKNEVQKVCREYKNFITSNIVLKFIDKIYNKNFEDIEKIIEVEAKKEISKIDDKISLLGSISNIAPSIGFLGTVTGFIQTFIKLSQHTSQINPALLSGGIYEAMVTTAAGLIIGIISYLFYNFFVTKLNDITNNLEYDSIYILEAIKYSKKNK